MNYCDCGRAADRLCIQCDRPTCAIKHEAHEARFSNVSARDYVFDVTAGNWSAWAACPGCLAMVAADIIAHVDTNDVIGYGSTFEQLCQIATGQLGPTILGSDQVVKGKPVFRIVEWRGPYLPAMTVGQFGKELATSLARRGISPGKVKTGRFTSSEMYQVRWTGGSEYNVRPYHFTSWQQAPAIYESLFVDVGGHVFTNTSNLKIALKPSNASAVINPAFLRSAAALLNR